MIDIDPTVGVYILWAVACVIAWGKVFADSWNQYKALPRTDRRKIQTPPESRLPAIRQAAFRDVVSDFALLLTSFAAFASLTVLVLGQEVPGLRGFFLAMALGGFVGAGIIRAWPDKRERREGH